MQHLKNRIHDAIKSYANKFIRPIDDAYLFFEVHGQFKNIKENDIVVIKRDGNICWCKVHVINYFIPRGDEFFGKLLWINNVEYI